MPTYDYVCENCEHEFEHFQSISSKPLKKCPECGKMRLKRLIGTGAGIIFKGSGFYETDYRSSEYKQKAKQESGGDSASSGNGETKSTGSSDSTSKSSDSSASSSTKSTSDSKSTGSSDKAGSKE